MVPYMVLLLLHHQIMQEALALTDDEYKLKRSSTGTVVRSKCSIAALVFCTSVYLHSHLVATHQHEVLAQTAC
jgi:hypothetical protein